MERRDGEGEGQSLKGKSHLRGRRMSRSAKMNDGRLLKGTSGKRTGRETAAELKGLNLTNRFLISGRDVGFPLVCISLLAAFRCNKSACAYARALPFP